MNGYPNPIFKRKRQGFQVAAIGMSVASVSFLVCIVALWVETHFNLAIHWPHLLALGTSGLAALISFVSILAVSIRPETSGGIASKDEDVS